jgi:hypothetical protein
MRKASLPVLVVFLALILPGPALPQAGKRQHGPDSRPPAKMSQDERRQLRQDVDSARGNYQQRDLRRQKQMPPEEREKLRRDVQDANRDIRRR